MKALLVERLPHRFAAARATSFLVGSGRGVGIGPLRLAELDSPLARRPGWSRVRPHLSGICGSDLSTVDGASSSYFESIVSFPFVLGHEIVGELLDGEHAGSRVVIEPVLGCRAREIDPPCVACERGEKNACEQISFGHLKPGLQTGYCADTGGGWSEELLVHDSQIHLVPDSLSDEDGVIVEPTACAIHAVCRGGVTSSDKVVVIGAGTLGLLTVAALHGLAKPESVLVVARHPVQRDFARRLGADIVVKEAELARAVRRLTGALGIGEDGDFSRTSGGADVVFDCVGTSTSITEAIKILRPGGRLVLVGMPGHVRVDLAPLWQREISIAGSYAYGTETIGDTSQSTFALALRLVEESHLGDLVSARYPLERYEEALRHAATAGRRGSVKVVFDLRRDRPKWMRSKEAEKTTNEDERKDH